MSEHEVAQWLVIFKMQNKSMENPKDFIVGMPYITMNRRKVLLPCRAV